MKKNFKLKIRTSTLLIFVTMIAASEPIFAHEFREGIDRFIPKFVRRRSPVEPPPSEPRPLDSQVNVIQGDLLNMKDQHAFVVPHTFDGSFTGVTRDLWSDIEMGTQIKQVKKAIESRTFRKSHYGSAMVTHGSTGPSLLHVITVGWDHVEGGNPHTRMKQKDAPKTISNAVENALILADTNGFEKVAIPLLGAAHYDMTHEQSAAAIRDGIASYEAKQSQELVNRPNRVPKEVTIVLHEKDSSIQNETIQRIERIFTTTDTNP